MPRRPPTTDRQGDHRRSARSPAGRYVSALLRWWLVGFLPPIGTAALIAAWTASVCDADSVDCTWGFEFLLVVPVALVCLVFLAPMAMAAGSKRRSGADRRVVWLTGALCGLGSVEMLYRGATGGPFAFWMATVVVAFGVPAIVVFVAESGPR